MKYFFMTAVVLISTICRAASSDKEEFEQAIKCEKAYTQISNTGLYDIPHFSNKTHDLMIVRNKKLVPSDSPDDNGTRLQQNLFLYETGVLQKITLPNYDRLYFENPKKLTVLIDDKPHCLTYDINSVLGDRIRDYSDAICAGGAANVIAGIRLALPATTDELKLATEKIQEKIFKDIEMSEYILKKEVQNSTDTNNQANLVKALYSWDGKDCHQDSLEKVSASLDELISRAKNNFNVNGVPKSKQPVSFPEDDSAGTL